MAQQCPGRKGFSPGALMSCFLSSPKWCPILRNSPASVLVVWTYIRAWQIHSALFGDFSGTEVNKSDSDSGRREPGWQSDASPGFPDPSVHTLLGDSSPSSAAPQEEWLCRTRTPPMSPNQEWSEMRVLVLWSKEVFLQFLWVKSLQSPKGLYLLIKGSFGIPGRWDSMQREFSESSLKINDIGRGKSPEINP